MFTRDLFQLGQKKSHKVLVVLELKEPEPLVEVRPALILMLENGHCVALGGNSPIVTYFPDWMSLAYFTDSSLDHYDANNPSEYELPDKWDTSELPLGPFG